MNVLCHSSVCETFVEETENSCCRSLIVTAKTPPRALIKVFVALHNFIYRVSGGRVAGRFGKGPVLLLTVKGRKTGKPQTVPLIYIATDRGFAVIASFAGSPTHPAWYLTCKPPALRTSRWAEGRWMSARNRCRTGARGTTTCGAAPLPSIPITQRTRREPHAKSRSSNCCLNKRQL